MIYSAAPIVGGLLIAGAEGFAWGTLVGAAIGQWAIPVLALRRLPGAVGRTSTYALCNVTFPYVLRIANAGIQAACAADAGFASSLSGPDMGTTCSAFAFDDDNDVDLLDYAEMQRIFMTAQ